MQATAVRQRLGAGRHDCDGKVAKTGLAARERKGERVRFTAEETHGLPPPAGRSAAARHGSVPHSRSRRKGPPSSRCASGVVGPPTCEEPIHGRRAPAIGASRNGRGQSTRSPEDDPKQHLVITAYPLPAPLDRRVPAVRARSLASPARGSGESNQRHRWQPSHYGSSISLLWRRAARPPNARAYQRPSQHKQTPCPMNHFQGSATGCPVRISILVCGTASSPCGLASQIHSCVPGRVHWHPPSYRCTCPTIPTATLDPQHPVQRANTAASSVRLPRRTQNRFGSGPFRRASRPNAEQPRIARRHYLSPCFGGTNKVD